MTIERRNCRRAHTHIPLKLIEPYSQTSHLGYLQNLTMEGMGIVSPDYLLPQSQYICQFSLRPDTPPLRIPGSLVHIQKDQGSFFYYGIKFNVVHPEYSRMIADYIESLPDDGGSR